MTEKRFQYNVNKNCIEYDGKFVASLNSIDGCRIANYWNGLYKENEQLKQSYKEFEDECQSTFNAMSRKQNDLYRKNFKLKEENEQLKKDLIDHSALISMLEDYQALKIEETLWNLTGAKSEEEFNELYKPYLEKAKRCWR